MKDDWLSPPHHTPCGPDLQAQGWGRTDEGLTHRDVFSDLERLEGQRLDISPPVTRTIVISCPDFRETEGKTLPYKYPRTDVHLCTLYLLGVVCPSPFPPRETPVSGTGLWKDTGPSVVDDRVRRTELLDTFGCQVSIY